MRVVLLCMLLFASCTFNHSTDVTKTHENAQAACVNRCLERLQEGPLDNECLGVVLDEWACDVANNPKNDFDQLIRNQCQSYRTGAVTKIIEVTNECELIQ